MPRRVLPQPALPQTRVGRPRGKPPPVISSRPAMPVGHFSKAIRPTSAPFTNTSHEPGGARPRRSDPSSAREAPRAGLSGRLDSKS